MQRIKNLISFWVDYRKQLNHCKHSNIKYINWVHPFDDCDENWFSQFINSRNILSDFPKTKIAFFSIFGSHMTIKLNRSDVKILYTGENIHRNEFEYNFTSFENYGISHGIDLGLGFDYEDNDHYQRFPLWILYFIKPNWHLNDLSSFCKTISYHDLNRDSRKFCSLVSSHDPNGLRSDIYNALSEVDLIDSSGRLLNNSNLLKDKYEDNKLAYLNSFKFNICPENTDSSGYVTEKIFQAIYSGCIPIYWGSDNNPEPKILNKDAIIFWNKSGDNSDAIKLITELNSNPKLYKEFASQPRLNPEADKYISLLLDNLETKIKKLIRQNL